MGNVMCWLREKASRRLRKEEDEQLGVSTMDVEIASYN